MQVETNEKQNEILLEKAVKFGKYHLLLFPVIYAILLLIKANDAIIIFGGYSPPNFNYSADSKNGTSEKLEFDSFVSTWALYGSLDYVPSLIFSIQHAGALFGGMSSGPVSDRCGRRITLIFVGIFMVLSGTLSVVSNSWQIMVMFRFLNGLGIGSVFSVGIVFLQEMVQTRYRFITQSVVDIGDAIGMMVAVGFAAALRQWRSVMLLVNCLYIPFLAGMFFFQESIRWLVHTGKISKANHALVIIQPNVSEKFVEEDTKVIERVRSIPFFELFKTALLRRFTFSIAFNGLVSGLLCFGYSLNVNTLTGSMYTNFLILGLFNFISPAFILILDRLKGGLRRKRLHTICLSTLILFSVIIIILKAIPGSNIALNIVSFCASSISRPLNTLNFLFSNEHFPTKLRNQANGLSLVFLSLGAVVAPFVMYSAKSWTPLPYIIFASLAALDIIIVQKLFVETRGKRLPELADFVSKEDEQRWIEHESVCESTPLISAD